MSTSQPPVRDLSRSPFPLGAKYDPNPQRWHSRYPENVPPGLVYPSMRAEQMLLTAASLYPTRDAIRYFRTSWSYTELCDRIRQVAGHFHRMGIGPGDRVLVALPNCPEFVASWFAIHWLGAHVVPANPLLSASEMVWLSKKTKARCVLGLDLRIEPILEMTRRIPIRNLVVVSLSKHLSWKLRLPYQLKCLWDGPIRADRNTVVTPFPALYEPTTSAVAAPLLSDNQLPAVLQPTGGTTGTPKIAVLSHQNLVCNVAQLQVWSGLEAGSETVLGVIPFFHVFGATVGLLGSLAGGATLVMLARFDPKVVVATIERHHPNVAPLVPFMIQQLVAELKKGARRLDSIRYCMSGASPLDCRIAEEFRARTQAEIIEGYGLSEASPVTHSNPPGRECVAGSIGLPMPDTIARIVDIRDGKTELQPGEIGELVIRGPQVMQGYLDNQAETDIALQDGWLHTGDLAQMDERGYFTIVDRKKDMIISGGLNIYPSEVERVLERHQQVRECAVIGVPDQVYGEKLVGYVVARDKAHVDPVQLQAHCRTELASYKIPRTIKVCEELPTNYLGKIRRVELRQEEADDDS